MRRKGHAGRAGRSLPRDASGKFPPRIAPIRSRRPDGRQSTVDSWGGGDVSARDGALRPVQLTSPESLVMPNDAKLGLVVGMALIIAVAVVFFRKDAGP